MYLNYFSLTRPPFDFLLEPDSTYWSPGLKALWTEVIQRLGNGHSPQFVIGRSGCGKSLFLHLLALHSIDQGHNCAYIDAAGHRADLFESLSHAYGLEYPSQNEEQYLTWFESFLASSRLGGIQNVLLLDNVHRLDPQALQKLVYLVKIRIDNTPLLHVVATVGEDEEREALELLAANQISVTPRPLPPLDLEHTGAYIVHRLKAAGHDSGDLFDEEVVEWIHARSRGIPREINYYADLFLTHAYLRHQRRIHARLIQLVDPTDTTRKTKEARAGIVSESAGEDRSERGEGSPRVTKETASDHKEGKKGKKSAEPTAQAASGPAPKDRRPDATDGGTKTPRGAEPAGPGPESRPSAPQAETGLEKHKADKGTDKTEQASPASKDQEKQPATTTSGKTSPPPKAERPPSPPPKEEAPPATNRRGLFLAAAASLMLVLAGLVLLRVDDAGETQPTQEATAEATEGQRLNTPIPVTRTPPAPVAEKAPAADGEPPTRVAKQASAPQTVDAAKTEPKKPTPADSPSPPRTHTEKKPAPSGEVAAPKATPKAEEPKKPAATTLLAKAEPRPETSPAPAKASPPPPPPTPRPSAADEEGKGAASSAQQAAGGEAEVAPPAPPPQETDSEFASFTPAPRGQDTLMAVQALDNLVHRFQWAYENADEHVLAEIFDPNIRTNENSGREAILKEYGQFFRVTQSRRLAIGPIEWQTSGAVSTGVGRFTAYVVTKRGKERTFTGTLTIETIATPKGPKITALYYRYDS